MRTELPTVLRCDQCRWWQPMFLGEGKKNIVDQLGYTDEPWGFCKRYPPTKLEVQYTDYENDNCPITSEGNYCGEWTPIPGQK